MAASRWGAALAAVVLVAVAACDGDDASLAPADPPSTVRARPVAAVAVAPGDCLDGVVLGAAERREIEAARVVPCDREHGFEVFATFELSEADLDVDDLIAYPGPARVVRAAERGCRDQLEAVAAEPEAFGLVAMWPSPASWSVGDRTVACAVFAPDGTRFEERRL